VIPNQQVQQEVLVIVPVLAFWSKKPIRSVTINQQLEFETLLLDQAIGNPNNRKSEIGKSKRQKRLVTPNQKVQQEVLVIVPVLAFWSKKPIRSATINQ
jgi:2-methylcitrate dehydratase PrpD